MMRMVNCELCGNLTHEVIIREGEYVCYDCFMDIKKKEAEDEWKCESYIADELE